MRNKFYRAISGMLVAAIIIEQYPCAVNAADVDTVFLGENEVPMTTAAT